MTPGILIIVSYATFPKWYNVQKKLKYPKYALNPSFKFHWNSCNVNQSKATTIENLSQLFSCERMFTAQGHQDLPVCLSMLFCGSQNWQF